jgi:peptide/nickel transport system permease protein
MIQYTIKRLISSIPILVIVAVMVFLLIHMIPGNPAALMLGSEATPEQIAELSAKMGLDQPLAVQFIKWAGDLLHGDFGDSLFFGIPVVEVMKNKVEPTALLVVYGMVIAMLIGIPAGVISAIYRERIPDRICMFISMLGISAPSFWLALNLIILFSINGGIFPAVGYESISSAGFFKSIFVYLTLPAFSLGVSRAASVARVTRSGMLDVLGNDYIRTAKAKGLSAGRVIVPHALKNAMNPVLTQIGISVAQLAGGAVVIETIFNIQGLGSLAFNAIQRRDYPMIQGYILIIAMVYIGINLLVDILYKVFDPRVNYK